MSNDTREFLASLYEPAPTAEAATAAPKAPGPTTPPAATAPGPVEGGTVATDDKPAASRFADWVRRPDATGRMGWEKPGLPEVDRWWADSTFEGLPEPSEGFQFGEPRDTVPQNRPSCVSRAANDTKYLPGMEPLQGQCEVLTGRENG